MGPTNIALVKLYRADQALREAQARLDAAARNVRIQERRVADLSEKLKLAQGNLKEEQSQAGQLDLDLKSRDAHIEKLRIQQQTTKNAKEYQAFLVEINTAKVDRNKVEDEAMKVLETVERSQAEAGVLRQQLAAEQHKLQTLQAETGERLKQLQAEVESLRPAREEAAAAVPARARDAFERLAEHHEGEAMSAIAKPDRRREEYLCTACNMSLVTDVYNKLHSRDELVFCPSCRRILYIPEDLPPQTAINTPKASPRRTRAAAAEKAEAAAEPRIAIEQRATGRWGELLSAAQGESVRAAVDADSNPVDLQVMINGELAGYYKGKSRENLERVIRFRMQEERVEGDVQVFEHPAQETGGESPADAAADTAESSEQTPQDASPHNV